MQPRGSDCSLRAEGEFAHARSYAAWRKTVILMAGAESSPLRGSVPS